MTSVLYAATAMPKRKNMSIHLLVSLNRPKFEDVHGKRRAVSDHTRTRQHQLRPQLEVIELRRISPASATS